LKPLSLPIVRFKRNYFLISLALLLIEIMIGAFMHDRFIRPYAGDFLVVILLYCFVRAFFNFQVIPVAIGVLLFSYFIEWTKYLKLADHLKLSHYSLSRILLGDYFSWTDILCYTAGILTVMVFERIQIQWHGSHI
jgi:hypothetical protein